MRPEKGGKKQHHPLKRERGERQHDTKRREEESSTSPNGNAEPHPRRMVGVDYPAWGRSVPSCWVLGLPLLLGVEFGLPCSVSVLPFLLGLVFASLLSARSWG